MEVWCEAAPAAAPLSPPTTSAEAVTRHQPPPPPRGEAAVVPRAEQARPQAQGHRDPSPGPMALPAQISSLEKMLCCKGSNLCIATDNDWDAFFEILNDWEHDIFCRSHERWFFQ